VTRDQGIRALLKILGPEANRTVVEHAVDSAISGSVPRVLVLSELDSSARGITYRPRNFSDKRTAGALRDTLRKAKTLFARPEVKHMFAREKDLTAWLSKLDHLHKAAQAIAKYPLPNPRKRDMQKVRAAVGAAALLEHHGIRLTKTRGGKFERTALVLAALACGTEPKGMRDYCVAHLDRFEHQ